MRNKVLFIVLVIISTLLIYPEKQSSAKGPGTMKYCVELSGIVSGYFFIPIDGITYRYSTVHGETDNKTCKELIFEFSDDQNGSLECQYRIYSLAEHPKYDLLLVTCTDTNSGAMNEFYIEYYPFGYITDETELETAAADGLLVLKNGSFYSRRDRFEWIIFYNKVSNGEPAYIRIASYYDLTGQNIAPALLESEKNNYPQMFYELLEYDGTVFTLSPLQKMDGNYIIYCQPTVNSEISEWKYLMHYSGPQESHADPPILSYEMYVLTDDNTVTWDEIKLDQIIGKYAIRNCRVLSFALHFELKSVSEMREIWRDTRYYPILPGTEEWEYYDRNYGDKGIYEIMNPPSDMMDSFSTQELAELIVQYNSFVYNEDISVYFDLLAENSLIFGELLSRKDCNYRMLRTYESCNMIIEDGEPIYGGPLFGDPDYDWHTSYRVELFCRDYIRKYASTFSDEDTILYESIQSEKNKRYDMIRKKDTREIFETDLLTEVKRFNPEEYLQEQNPTEFPKNVEKADMHKSDGDNSEQVSENVNNGQTIIEDGNDNKQATGHIAIIIIIIMGSLLTAGTIWVLRHGKP